jgi:hypothetical protein
MNVEERCEKLKKSFKIIAEALAKNPLPEHPQSLIAIGVLAPDLGDFLDVVGKQLIEVSSLIDD